MDRNTCEREPRASLDADGSKLPASLDADGRELPAHMNPETSSESLRSLMQVLFGEGDDNSDSDVGSGRDGGRGCTSNSNSNSPDETDRARKRRKECNRNTSGDVKYEVVGSCKALSESSPSEGLHQLPIMPGLHQVKGFLCVEDQLKLRAILESEPWFLQGANQSMRFGDLPQWALQLSDRVYSLATAWQLLPEHICCRKPLFDQMIVNLYHPGEGITSHVDLARFEDGIVSISFGDPVVMKFTPQCSLLIERSNEKCSTEEKCDMEDKYGTEEQCNEGKECDAEERCNVGEECNMEEKRSTAEKAISKSSTIICCRDGAPDLSSSHEPDCHPEPDAMGCLGTVQGDTGCPGPDSGTEHQPGLDTGTINFPGPDTGNRLLPGLDTGTVGFPGLDRGTGHQPGLDTGSNHYAEGPLCGKLSAGESEVQVLLEGGDLLLLHGPARYEWAHGIDAVAEEWFNGGQHIVRGTRLSVTLRRVCQNIVLREQ